MMRSSIYNVLDKLNELEKQADRLNEKCDDAYQEGKTKKAEYYRHEATDVAKEITGMVHCLKMLGLGAWRQCDRDTNYLNVWHIPLDDIERVC
jgi:hypothetical protein